MQQYQIDVQTMGGEDREFEQTILTAAEMTLKHENIKTPVSVNVLVANDQLLQELNHQFLGENHPTDVLSFPMDSDISGLENHLGDIAISRESAAVQANKAGHSLQAEIQLLVVHGLLHLLGYDHDDAEDQQRMWSIQAEILSRIGSEIRYPTMV